MKSTWKEEHTVCGPATTNALATTSTIGSLNTVCRILSEDEVRRRYGHNNIGHLLGTGDPAYDMHDLSWRRCPDMAARGPHLNTVCVIPLEDGFEFAEDGTATQSSARIRDLNTVCVILIEDEVRPRNTCRKMHAGDSVNTVCMIPDDGKFVVEGDLPTHHNARWAFPEYGMQDPHRRLSSSPEHRPLAAVMPNPNTVCGACHDGAVMADNHHLILISPALAEYGMQDPHRRPGSVRPASSRHQSLALRRIPYAAFLLEPSL